MHFRQLDDDSLNEEEFEVACKKCIEETENAFADDAPPLDNELIYDSIINTIRCKRERAASEWMQQNVPDLETIKKFEASAAMQTKILLQKMPCILSTEQEKTCREALSACERRLDELEIEGLFARFKALSERNKKQFLKKISGYL